MIKVNVGNNVKRTTIIIDETKTIRQCFDEAGVKYTGSINLDGTILRDNELDCTFVQLGIEPDSECSLLSVVKSENG